MAKGISDDLIKLLSASDKRNGFPPGTMYAVMQQEVGGNTKFIDDPTAYHYAADKDGRRIAKHTGKVSTAFGPFGIVESTGKDPGYGVQPLKDKSLEEQVRFASDYLAARSKQAGSLEKGLSGYGEGGAYGKQVMGRMGKGAPAVAQAPASASVPTPAPVSVPTEVPVQLAQTAPPAVVEPVAPAAQDSWQEFLARARGTPEPAEPVQMADLQYGAPRMDIQVPDFMASVGGYRRQPQIDFSAFGSWGPMNGRA